MRTLAAIGLLALAYGLAGCGSSRSSSTAFAPSPVVPTVPTGPQSNAVQVDAWVLDSAFRPLTGATVEVVDGPQAGLSASANAEGRLSLKGVFDSTTTFRAAQQGHVAASRTWTRHSPSARPILIFYLASIAPPADIAGTYTLTFMADSACVDIPRELRTRTYAATVTPSPDADHPANTRFDVTVSVGQFLPDYRRFPIGVAGRFVAFELAGERPHIVEEVAPNTYLGFDGRAEASVVTSRVSTIGTSFEGRIDYCALGSAMGQHYDCRPALANAHAECSSRNHQLILTRH